MWATAEAEGLDLNAYRSERNQYGFLGVHSPNPNPDPDPNPNPNPNPNPDPEPGAR